MLDQTMPLDLSKSKKVSLRNYHMPDADLLQLAKDVSRFAQRDLSKFTEYGVTQDIITDFMHSCDEFGVFATDEELSGNLVIATEVKNTKANNLRVSIRNVMARVENVFGADSGQYRKFGVEAISKSSDAELFICCKRVIRVATEFQTQLQHEGVTTPLLNNLNDYCDQFETALNEQKDAIAARDIITEQRIDTGNQLYALLVKFTNYGKQIWKNTDEAKYNDYVIYSSGTAMLGKPLNPIVNYNNTPIPKIVLSWDIVDGSVGYSVYFSISETGSPSGDYIKLEQIYTTNNADLLPIFNKRNYFKIRAFDSQNVLGPYSNEVFVDIPAAV